MTNKQHFENNDKKYIDFECCLFPNALNDWPIILVKEFRISGVYLQLIHKGGSGKMLYKHMTRYVRQFCRRNSLVKYVT